LSVPVQVRVDLPGRLHEVVGVIRFKGIPSSEDREKIREGIEKFLKSL